MKITLIIMSFGLMFLTVTLIQAAIIQVPSDQPDLASAFSIAVNGDTIRVASGTYSGPNNRNLDFSGRDLIVESESGYATCIIDCEDLGRAFILDDAEDESARITGFTIRNGSSTEGGAIYCINGIPDSTTGPIVSGCRFTNNYAITNGAIYVYDAALQIRDCTFYANQAGNGGAVYCMLGNLIVERTVFESNQASWGGGIFGGLETTIVATDCSFLNNNTPNSGGGMCVQELCVLYLTNCSFWGNSSGGPGGAICCRQYADINLWSCNFLGNTAVIGGGAIGVRDANFSYIDRCRFEQNEAWGEGGAIRAERSTIEITNSVFDTNQVTTSLGYGGHLYLLNSAITMWNGLLIDGDAPDGGGAIYVAGGSHTFRNVTIAGNDTTVEGDGIYVASGTVAVQNSIVWSNGDSNIFVASGGVSVAYTDIGGGWSGTGNLNSNPLFTTGPEGDNYLSSISAGQVSNSPCVDSGNGSSSVQCFDLLNGQECLSQHTTRTDLVTDSGQSDMGWHYPLPTPVPTPDIPANSPGGVGLLLIAFGVLFLFFRSSR